MAQYFPLLSLVCQEALEKLKMVNWHLKLEFRPLSLIKLVVLNIYNLVPIKSFFFYGGKLKPKRCSPTSNFSLNFQ